MSPVVENYVVLSHETKEMKNNIRKIIKVEKIYIDNLLST